MIRFPVSVKTTVEKFLWNEGNITLHARNYDSAIQRYLLAKEALPELAFLIERNIRFAKHQIEKKSTLSLTHAINEIDIVVPVFNALDSVRNCLESLVEHSDSFLIRIIIVNDGSESETNNWLRDFCHNKPRLKLIEHAKNLGYTKTVNHGLKVSTAPYVITLNSDTIVTSGWLRRMVRCLESDPRIGIVGPLSNAANWQNVPYLKDHNKFVINRLPDHLSVEDMGKLVANVSRQQYPRIPIINGFCFMIRRAVIDAIGYMDEKNFPLGYGEENDYCIRATYAGFDLAVADDVYVFHAKSKSFGEKKRLELTQQGIRKLQEKYTSEKYADIKNILAKNETLSDIRQRIRITIEEQLRPNSVSFDKSASSQKNKPSLLLLAGKHSGRPGSFYVRVALPYQSSAVLQQWRVTLVDELPQPGSANVVLIARQALGYPLYELQAWLPQWQAAGGKLIYELDDDMLDAEGLQARHYKGDLSYLRETVQFLAQSADLIHVSTAALAEKMCFYNAKVQVIPNALDKQLWKLEFPQHCVQSKAQSNSTGPVRIGYVGTATHDADLALVATAMQKLEAYYGKKIEIEVIGGYKNLAPQFGNRIELPTQREYPTFVEWLQDVAARWDIGIIPLIDDSFNRSKSYLKFLEYAALDLAIVVSDVPTYRNIAKHGENCLLAQAETSDWVEKLSQLIEDRALRLRLAQRAREECLVNHTLESHSSVLLDSLNSVVKHSKRSCRIEPEELGLSNNFEEILNNSPYRQVPESRKLNSLDTDICQDSEAELDLCFRSANKLFREKKYSEALLCYQKLYVSHPALSRIVAFNICLAQKRLGLAGDDSQLPAKKQLGLFTILDGNQLEEKTDHRWLSTGEDPHFYLDPQEILIEGTTWYQLQLNIQGPRKKQISRLYLDAGKGFNEEETINLQTKSGTLSCRVMRLGQMPKNLRFDPCDIAGELQIRFFHIHPVSQNEAQRAMLEYLVTNHYLPTKTNLADAWCIIEQKARKAKQEPLDFLYTWYDSVQNTPPGAVEYSDWIDTVETPSLPSAETTRQTLEKMPHKPLISIVIPVYNTPEIYLRACIESVLTQSYPHWELCIADDASPQPHVIRILEDYAHKDQRIRYVRREINGHISHASNSALELATGEFVALLDHDDLLAEHALYFMALAVQDHPDAAVFYSDEDKIDAHGNRNSPHFKSDWNPDLFFSQNYVSHLGVYRRRILQKIGGFRSGVEGSQDQDLLLRCLPHARHDQIIHIPRILYHWRALEGSTALASSEKSYTTEAGIKALHDYFAENGPLGIEVNAGKLPNTYHVRWPVPEPAPLVSLLIPARDKKDLTEVAVCSILGKTTYQNYEILILDNGSVEQETLDWFDLIQKQDKRVQVLRYDHPFNYSAINNFGVQHARGSVIGLINNDIEVISPDWLTEMLGQVCRKEIGCVGAKLYYSNNKIQHAGVFLGIGGVAGHAHKRLEKDAHGYFSRLKLIQSLSAVTAACLLVRKEIYEQVGGLDEANLKIAFNDVDFCLKVREAGYRNLWTPWAELYHHESISRGAEDTPEKKARFSQEVRFMKEKWGKVLESDPYYSSHLTRDREDFSIKNQ